MYPQLQPDGNNFRLTKCSEILSSLEGEFMKKLAASTTQLGS